MPQIYTTNTTSTTKPPLSLRPATAPQTPATNRQHTTRMAAAPCVDVDVVAFFLSLSLSLYLSEELFVRQPVGQGLWTQSCTLT